MNFADRIVEAQRKKLSVVVLGIDPQLDSADTPGIPSGYTLERFCCEAIEACESSIVAVKPQLAFFEARGLDGMRAFTKVVRFARARNLLTIADAKRGDISTTAAAYAEAFLGDGDFACDAVCVNPYLGTDAIMPFVDRVKNGRGLFVIVKTSNPGSADFQDLPTPQHPVWETVARTVDELGSKHLGSYNLSPVGAVIGATYPKEGRRARELMPNTLILVPGYGAQGGTASDAVAAARSDGLGIVVNASRSILYASAKDKSLSFAEAAGNAAEHMRCSLNDALAHAVRRDGDSSVSFALAD